jgi:hypothetical protein
MGTQVTRFKPEDVVFGCTGRSTIPGPALLEIEWRCQDGGAAVSGRLWLRDSTEQQLFYLDAEHPTQHFQLEDGERLAQGEVALSFGQRTAQLAGDIQTGPGQVFEGPIAEWLLDVAPSTHTTRANDGVVITHRAPTELLSFLCLAEPAAAPAAIVAERFVAAPASQSLPLVVQLASARKQADGAVSMRALAAEFEDGADFVPTLATLGAPFDSFPRLAFELWQVPGDVPLSDLVALCEHVLGQPLAEFLASSSTVSAQAGLWQSLYAEALVSAPAAVPTELTLGVRVLAFLVRLEDADIALTRESGRHGVLAALPVVPLDVTPPGSPTSANAGGFCALLGPGSVAVIEQRLLRYEPGEIAFTLNLMPRERRLLSERHLTRRTNSEQDTHADQRDEDTREQRGARSELDDELRDMLGAQSTCRNWTDARTYGDNGLTLSDAGSAQRVSCPQERRVRAASAYAQRLTREAATRVGTRVRQHRVTQLVEQQERVRRVELDNRAGNTPEIGIYRWLHKRLALSLRERGLRLIVEFMSAAPARPYLDALTHLPGAVLALPTPPAALEPPITSASDITPENYLLLGARYAAGALAAPPEAQRSIQKLLQHQPPEESAELTVPEHYVPLALNVTWLIADARQSLVGFVGAFVFGSGGGFSSAQGRATVGAPASSSSGRAPAARADNSAGASLPMRRTLAAEPAPCAPCADPFQPAVPLVPATGQVTASAADLRSQGPRIPVAVVCAASEYVVGLTLDVARVDFDEAYATWQWRTYEAIQAGYERQVRAYYEQLGQRVRASARGRERAIETRCLAGESIELLWQRHALEGQDEAAYKRYFERAFEWEQSAYRFYPWGPGQTPDTRCDWTGEGLYDPDSERLFQRFLVAGSARLLAPVTPGDELTLLYYLRYGTLPPWSAADTPVAAPDVPLVARLLEGRVDPPTPSEWTEDVATTLVVLETGPLGNVGPTGGA